MLFILGSFNLSQYVTIKFFDQVTFKLLSVRLDKSGEIIGKFTEIIKFLIN